jgi:hypothetical protein
MHNFVNFLTIPASTLKILKTCRWNFVADQAIAVHAGVIMGSVQGSRAARGKAKTGPDRLV